MDLVSIIIPVYNSEKYIGRCLDSILNQTYSNIEIIVINDVSKDNSKDIIIEYKNKYSNIVFIDQENIGVSKTRNNGIKIASGKYIMFMDNDDFIDNDYVETYVNEAIKKDFDVVIGGYRRPDSNGKIITELGLIESEWSKFMIMTPWAKIFKKEYLINNDITFFDNNIGEDVYFNLKAMLISKSVKITNYIGYNWYFNNESVSNTIQKNIKNLKVYEFLNASYDLLIENNLLNDNYDILETHFIRYIVWMLSFSTKRFKYKDISYEYDKAFSWLKERFPNYKKNKNIGFNKPIGESLSSRVMLKMFMIFHKIHLGKIVVYLYSKI